MPSRVDAPIWFNICGDLSSIVAVDKEPIAVNIKSQTIADGLKKYFQLLWNQEVQVESGTDALHRVYYDMLAELESGDEYFVLGVTHGKEPEKVLDFFDTYHAERLKKNVSVNMIVSPEAYETIVEQYKKLGDNDFQLSHIKKLASEHPQPFHIILFNNKTRILIYGEEPTVLYFDRPEMYEGFKGYFDTLWSQKTKTFQGKGAKEEAFEDIINTLEAGEEVLVMSIFNFDPEFASFIENFHIRRAKQGIRARFLFNHNAREMGERLSSIDLTDVAYMEKGFVTQSAFLIYKNKTLISLPNERTFIQIESQEATNSFRVYFEQQWHQETRVIRGAEAVKNIWLEAVEVGELRFIGARGYFVDRYPEMFAEIEKKAGQKKGLKWKNVVDTSAKNHKLNKLPWMEPRFNMKGSKNPNVIWLWGEKVAIANWTEDEPVVFISTNKHLVQSYQDYFDELWNQ